MDFYELQITCSLKHSEILIAEFSMISFDSFVENETGFLAYIGENDFNETSINEIHKKYLSLFPFQYTIKRAKKKNWNAEWEKDYAPIFVKGMCVVKTSFHDIKKKFPYEIIINPKMSFGTGHHETTYLMLKNQMLLDHKNKSVADIGCGTGILAIMASKLGASSISACDIDEWCIENSMENFELNDCQNIDVQHGTVELINGVYDIVLANINRNVLLGDIPQYANLIKIGGNLLISGFYSKDVDLLTSTDTDFGLKIVSTSTRNKWTCLLFTK